ncbi:MAG: hypothetical protein J6C06_01120 [Lachnospiraceae bacterium]|nr:hypothetical protein [Lachnospiraceae bacterium]
MIYRCPNCNGALEYNPITDEMECAHCGDGYTMQEMEAGNQKQFDYASQNASVAYWNEYGMSAAKVESEDHIEENNIYAEPEIMECKIYTCTSCGAELSVNDTEVSTYCAYCGQPTIVYSRVSQEQMPKYILPFRITREQALDIVRERFGKGFLVPKEIKNFDVENVKGIYVPYFLFDAYYYDNQRITFSEGVGDKKKTRFVDFEAECEFKKISCDASKRLNDKSTQRLEPFNLDELREFEPAYLSGFYADRYDLSARQLTNAVVRRCKDLFDAEMKRQVRNENAAVLKSKPKHTIRNSEYALLPVWFLTFRYKNEPYTMLVNGQTGKAVGAVPCNKAKAGILFAIIAVVTSAILGVGGCLLYNAGVNMVVFVALLVLGLVLLLIGISQISVYKKNMKLTKLNQTARFAGERQEV